MKIRINKKEKSYTYYIPFEVEEDNGQICEGVIIENCTMVGDDPQVETDIEWNTCPPPPNKDSLRAEVLRAYASATLKE